MEAYLTMAPVAFSWYFFPKSELLVCAACSVAAYLASLSPSGIFSNTPSDDAVFPFAAIGNTMPAS